MRNKACRRKTSFDPSTENEFIANRAELLVSVAGGMSFEYISVISNDEECSVLFRVSGK